MRTTPKLLTGADDLNLFVEICLKQEDSAPLWGSLQGAPVVLKDCLFHRGRVPTMGSRVLPRAPRPDSEAVARIEAAGGIIAAYANMHEWAVGGTSSVSAFGPVVNPRDPAVIAGGSSGGSAAAVAAGLVPMAVGTDAAGSIRIPAACCGIVGLKPTFGLVPTAGYVGDGGLNDHIGPMAGGVEDAARLFGVLAGQAVQLPDAGSLRIGIARGGAFDDVQDEVGAAFEAALGVLREVVASVSDVSLPTILEESRANAALFLAHTAGVVGDDIEDRAEDFEPSTLRWLRAGRDFSAPKLAEARALGEGAKARWEALFDQVDVILTPTLPALPPAVGADTISLPSGPTETDSVLGRFNGAMNLAGLPCLSLPCGEVGVLTVNMSLTASAGNDASVLALGRAFELATDERWVGRVAPSRAE
jgi:aspartyl-tRNA(Asn)/glutamyl-tRNA(Gln) amidotransferase subunit A